VPGLGDIAKDYAFLDDVVPHYPVGAVRRATATIGFETGGFEMGRFDGGVEPNAVDP
jgi:hypothetical protein